MAFVVKDRVKQTTTTTGTSDLVLSGSVSGFQSFSNALADGDTTYYALFEVSTNEWEVGVGTWTESTTTLARTTVLASSNSGSKVSLTAQAEVFITQPAGKAAFFDPSGDLTLVQDPSSNLQAATKQYVDTIAAAGLHYHDPVRVEQEGNLSATYDNGTSGVGATLTNNSTQAALTIDGVALLLNDRVLIYEQTNGYENGIYTVTNVGSASTNWVLTRATDADSYAPSDPNSLGQGDAFFVLEGTAGAGELYVMNTEGTITFGTTNITFTQVAATAVYTAGTGLTLTGTEFAADGANITNVDAVTLDGIDSSQFLRSDVVDTKTAGNLNFSDNVKAVFGDGSDLEIYHDGSNSYVSDSGTGALHLRSTGGGVKVVDNNNAVKLTVAVGTGDVTATGDISGVGGTFTGDVDVTGTVTADGLTVNSGGDQEVYFGDATDGIALANTGAVSSVEFGNSQGTAAVGKFTYDRATGKLVYAEGANGSEDDHFAIDGTGKVGIQTTSPRAPLHVAPTGAASDNFNVLVSQFRPNIVLEDLSTSATDFQLFADGNELQFRYGDASTDTKLATEGMALSSSGVLSVGGNTVLDTSTTFGGDVSGTYNAIVVANDSHTHAFNNLTDKTSGTGEYSTSSHLVSGRGSGGVALTINDGYGNANVTFNHKQGVPEQNGNAARIEVNTDSTTGANMNFEVKSGVTSGTTVQTTSILNLSETQVTAYKPLDVTGAITASGAITSGGNTVLTTADYDVQVCHLKTNVNSSVTQGVANEFTVNFNLEEHNDTSTFSHSSGVVTVATAGWYRIVANLVYENGAASQRNTIRAYVKKNGTEVTSTATYDYDRGTSYGEFSNNKINTMLYLAANDTIEIANYGQNIDGTVTIQSEECEFMVSSETVQASSSNADTVDGLHASQFVRSDTADTMTGNLTLNGTLSLGSNVINDVEDIYLRDKLFHDGDTNTYLGFASDTINLVTAGQTEVQITNNGLHLVNSALHEDYDALSGTSVTIDPNTGGAWSLTMTGNTTFTFGTTTNNYSVGLVVELTGNGGTVTWPSSVEWAGGTAPDAPASGETDIYVFWTRNGGTTWYGVQSIDAAA